MAGYKGNNAWVVMVPHDNDLKRALLSGSVIRKSGTTAHIVALVSTTVTNETINELNTVYDMVVVEKMLTTTDFFPMDFKQKILLNTLTLTAFSKLVVVMAGVLLCRGRADDLFESEVNNKMILVDDKETLIMALITPDVIKYAKNINSLKLERTETWANFLNLIFENYQLAKPGVLKVCKNEVDIFEATINDDIGITYMTEKEAAKLYMELNSTEKEGIQVEIPFNVDESNWVAIVGMSCRFPEANSIDEYWELLVNGRNTCGTVPIERTKLVDMDPTIKANFLKCPLDQFDAQFFGFSPTEAAFTDPQARLLLEVSWEALEDAGIDPNALRGTDVGIFLGSWLQEYKEAMNENCSAPSKDFIRKYLGNAFGSTAAKLSFFYGMTGPNVSTESGCSSSMVAIDMASKSLRQHECSIALACGANLILNVNKQNILWAEDGKSKTFDAGADGYARAEGIGVLVLKRYSEALLDNDTIHGIIRGTGTSQEGLSKSFGTPTVQSEYDSMRKALVAAKVTPVQVDYVEAHATGTAVGDPIEAAAIIKAYQTVSVARESPLIIGSGKTNLGHTESCSGMAGVIKVLMSMKHELIPKHINFAKINPQIDFTPIPGMIPLEPISWPRKSNGRPRISGVSSFGITGTDVHVIIQEPPTTKEERQNKNTSSLPQILTLSARSSIALEQMTKQFFTYLETSSNQHDIQDITYTANVCRAHHPIRRAILGSNKLEMLKNIRNGHHMYTFNNDTSVPRNVCFSFPGLIGKMSLEPIRKLYQTIPYFKQTMDSCDQIFKLVFSSEGTLVKMLMRDTKETPNTPKGVEWYALLLCFQFSLAKLWIHWGIIPNLVMGHCFGEFSAAVICGALELKDVLEMFKMVPHFVQSQSTDPASMIALFRSRKTVENLIQDFFLNYRTNYPSDWIDIAVVNSDFQTVVVGRLDTINAFQQYCVLKDIKVKGVPVDFCPHSRAIENACQKSLQSFNKVIHHPIKIPFISSLTGELVKDSELNGMFWYRVQRNSVDFKQACQSAMETQLADVFLEIGLDASMTKFTKDNLHDDQTLINFLPSFPRKEYGIYNTLAEMYALGINVNWSNFHGCKRRNKVRLPHYPFQRKSFWYERRPRSHSQIQLNSLKEVHPLLGSDIGLPPLGNFAVFRNDNYLCEDRQTSFIFDHVIGSEVIFPGAGFLEMMISSWKLAMNLGNISSLSVEKFTIHEPMLLDKSTTVSIVSVVNKDTGNISIYAINKSQWKLHASAESIKSNVRTSTYQLEHLRKDIINTENDDEGEASSNKFYLNAAKVGLNFGPTFKSLKRIYVNDNGDTLGEVKSLLQTADSFCCHPIYIDAMIQGFMVHSKPSMTKLCVPIKINKFEVVSPTPLTVNRKYFVHCQNGSTTVTLLDQTGQVVALMRSPELVATTVENVLAAPAKNPKSILSNSISVYDVYWKRAKYYQRSTVFTEQLSEPLDSGSPCKVFCCEGQISVISARKTDIKLSNVRKSAKWIVFEFENGAFEEYKHLMEQATNRNYHAFYLDPKLSTEELQGYLNECLRGDIEGILAWMCQSSSITCDPTARAILEPVLYISKYLQQAKLKTLPKFHLVTGDCWDLPPPINLTEYNSHGLSLAQAWGFMRSARMELPKVLSKSIDLEMSSKICDKVNQLATEFWLDDQETEVVYRQGTRYVSRLKENTIKPEPIKIPNVEMFKLELPKSKLISDIKFVETSGNEQLKQQQVKVEVRSVALNFKDVLAVLKPSSEFNNLTSIGFDFSGVVTDIGTDVVRWKMGDEVFGFKCDEGCMRSHLMTNENLLITKPSSATFAEAATLPTVFATAWHCMVNVARLGEGQTMLLHAASGGVGLAAIQIAKVLGVHVIGTAGSEKKRRFLKRLGVEHVFSSRTLDFKHEITKVTRGQRVDMVLNCLTGPRFIESSLAVCRDGGHFVEISKLDIWSVAEVLEKRPQVNYTIVDLTTEDDLVIEPIVEKLSEMLVQGNIRPLHHKAFPANYLSHALSYLQKAKHIGKVVINMPINNFNERKTCIFNDRSTYLITGGKTGIGFAVCKWMVREQGAKYVVLVSRSPPNENVKREIMNLQSQFGATIICKEVDVSDYSQCKSLIEHDLKGLPPLRGVHHCAATLSDQLISKQDWSNFERVISPKAGGAWNLHRLTMEIPLEHFVLYSSAVSVFGNAGQTNYVCANAYLDNLALLRTSMGLPALSINWGQWKAGLAENVEMVSFNPFSIEEGIQALSHFMQCNNEQENMLVAGTILFPGILKLAPYFRSTFLEEIVTSSSVSGENEGLQPIESSSVKAVTLSLASQIKQCTDQHTKAKVVKKFVLQTLCDTLGTSKDDIKDDAKFIDMGMDSLMSIEFTNKINSALEEIATEEDGVQGDLSIQLDLEETGTLIQLTTFILKSLE